MLLREFGIPSDFQIFIDGEQLTADDIAEEEIEVQLELSDGSTAQLITRFLPTQGAMADTGIAVRVDGRILDRAPDFVPRDDPELPRGALRRLVIEVNDGLSDDVTDDWSGVIENSRRFQMLKDAVTETVNEQYRQRLERETPESEQQFVGRFEEQLELLPSSERDRARRALYTVLRRVFSEHPEMSM